MPRKREVQKPFDPDTLDPRIRKGAKQSIVRYAARPVRLQLKVTKTGPHSFQHEPAEGFHPKLAQVQAVDACGTTSVPFKDRLLSQIATVLDGKTEAEAQQDVNSALAVLDGAKPENEVEAMLVAQMVVTNDAAMRCLAQVGRGMLPQSETFGGLAVKLLRTYTAQVEALAKLRRKGEQTVTVTHVYPGGQAVVGDVHHHSREGGVSSELEGQPRGAEELAVSTALPCPDPTRDGVPVPGNAERPMPAARRTVTRRADRKPERT